MQGFGISRDIIIKKLNNGEKLSWEELLDVFSCEDKAIAKTVHYLLIKLEGESRDLLVNLINEDFKIWPHYALDSEGVDPICFDKWRYVCMNKETKKFLLNIVPKVNNNNEMLNDFKNSLFNDMLSK